MSVSDAYASLSESLGYPDSKRLRSILEALMTAEQAEMAAALPGTVAEVAAKVGADAAKVQEELDALFFKGAVFPRGDFIERDYFRFARYALQLHDATIATQQTDIVKHKAYLELWHDFCMNEMLPTMGRGYAAAPAPTWRIVPAYKALEGLADVQPCDDIRELFKAQEKIAVVPCACRHRTVAVGEPCEHTDEEARWKCIQFGRAADYVIKRGSGIELSVEEVLDLNEEVETDGLLHMWPNTANTEGIHSSCQCCRDCCIFYVPMDMLGESIGKIWAKSRYEAYVETDQCDGCQDCVERCQFDAIDMVKPEGAPKKGKGAKKLKAVVDPEKCWGCGVCLMACDEAKAMKFKVVRPIEHIPAATL